MVRPYHLLLILSAVATIAVGFWLLNGLGPKFGLGE